jgi:hypothetical protein
LPGARRGEVNIFDIFDIVNIFDTFNIDEIFVFIEGIASGPLEPASPRDPSSPPDGGTRPAAGGRSAITPSPRLSAPCPTSTH